MASTAIEPQISPKPHKRNNFIGENYELALNQSMQNLLDSHRKPHFDFSPFTSTFYELMLARVDPPLETIWVYSALNFRCNNSPKDEPLSRLSVTKELLQSISACSTSCSSLKSIALIAPVIYEVYGLIVDLKGKDLGAKREKKIIRDIRSLVDVILGYIGISLSKDSIDEEELDSDADDTIWPLEDLVCVWFADRVDDNSEARKGFRLFFPLLNDEIIERLSKSECDVSELAAVVILEAFLLRLCLDFLAGVGRPELQKELRTWAVGSITGFKNFHFFETLVRMLLGPTLPVICLLNTEDETFLRKVLYDAVILVDYSFFHPERLVHLPAKHIKCLTTTRLIVAHEAIELFRKEGNQSKAISYINAFSTSHLPSQLLKLASSEVGMGDQASGPNGSSPKAFLKWLINLEEQGIKLLDDGISKCCAGLVLDLSKADYEQLACEVKGKKSDADMGFYIDNKGEEEDRNKEEKTNESMNVAFMAAARTMNVAENGGERKRKEGRSNEKKKLVKFLKHDLNENSGSSREKFTLLSKDGSSSESEVENPLSEEDMEVNEQ